ncbi:MAG: hypothetical protein KDC37_05115 [Flavobacteriales bacterium]|nr:hypothetical protein [Flavobacteriales bacterium]
MSLKANFAFNSTYSLPISVRCSSPWPQKTEQLLQPPTTLYAATVTHQHGFAKYSTLAEKEMVETDENAHHLSNVVIAR